MYVIYDFSECGHRHSLTAENVSVRTPSFSVRTTTIQCY